MPTFPLLSFVPEEMEDMRQAAPHRTGLGGPQGPSAGLPTVSVVVKENPAVVVGRRGCCMAGVARRLLAAHGVSPVVHEVGDDAEEIALIKGLGGRDDADGEMALPVVFIGGELVGGLERVMAVHISGELDIMLKEAGALWL